MTINNRPNINELPPISSSGIPTTFMSFSFLKKLFENHNRGYTPPELSRLLLFPLSEIELMCRQLKEIDFLSEDSSDPAKLKYNLRCKNVELQANFERFLVEAFLGSLPVYLMLDYSPSYRNHQHLRP